MKKNSKKLAMVDFWSVSDANGKPLGHGEKVGNEYYEYIKDQYFITQYVNSSLLPYIQNPNKHALNPSIGYGENKIPKIIKHFKALRAVFHMEDNIWFYVPDIYLFIFLLLFNKKNKKVAVNVYEEYSTNWLKHRIFLKSLSKVDVIFVTNEELLKDIPQGILIPDYTYDEKEYTDYVSEEKEERVVCLGTMNEKKKLREAVEAFSINGYPLYIAGQFSDREKYEELISTKTPNVIIEDRYVGADEYYELLGSSKFCLIPYDATFYKNRTSGVIQESLFCDAIPISDKSILSFSHIPGIGYDEIGDLKKMDFYNLSHKCYLNEFVRIKKEKYSREVVKKAIQAALDW